MSGKFKKIILIAIIVIMLFFTLSVSLTLYSLKDLNSKLITELRDSKVQIDIISQSLSLLAYDTNKMRTQIGISDKDYPIFHYGQNADITEEDNEVLQIFKVVETVNNKYVNEQEQESFIKFKTNENFKSICTGYTIIDEELYTLGLYKNKNKYFSIKYNTNDASNPLTITSINSEETVNGLPEEEIISYINKHSLLLDTYYNNIKEMSGILNKCRTNIEIADLLKEKSLTISSVNENTSEYFITITFNKEEKIRASLDKFTNSFLINKFELESPDNLFTELISKINNIDFRTEQEKAIENASDYLINIFLEEDFNRLLNTKEIIISNEKRENTYFIYYDILKNNEKIGCFAIDKFSYEIYLTDKDEIQIGSLRSLLENTESKKKN